MTALEVLLVTLAAFRLTRLITTDMVADPVREAWWRRFRFDTKPGEFIACNYCVGWWVSGGVLWAAASLGLAPWRWRTLVLWPVVAGGQALWSVLDERLAR